MVATREGNNSVGQGKGWGGVRVGREGFSFNRSVGGIGRYYSTLIVSQYCSVQLW